MRPHPFYPGVRKYVTMSGTVLTENDLRLLADDPNHKGYCSEIVETNDYKARCFQPTPCSIHNQETTT